MNRDQPFNDIPLLPPKQNLETPAILKKAIAAHRELAQLKGMGGSIPNQAVILQLLALHEAKLSSEIENIVTTDDELYRAFGDSIDGVDAQTKEVLNYKDALWHGYREISENNRLLSTPLFEELVNILAAQGAGVRTLPGTKLANPFGETIYTPPEGESLIRNLLANMTDYIYTDTEVDPLIQLAVMHYQFEAIHPFYDGNGRTGRILNVLYLIEKKLLDLPILYLSRFIIEHKNDYYSLLNNVTSAQEWEPWVLFILEGIYQTAQFTKKRMTIMQELIQSTASKIRAEAPKIYSREFVDVLFQRPYCRVKFLEDANIAGRQTAAMYLRKLEAIGILQSLKRGRERYYINKAFLQALIK